MGQDRHDSIDGEAVGSQSVAFSARLSKNRLINPHLTFAKLLSL
jgi:hypothetical protein